MQHFTDEHENLEVVDSHGNSLGRIIGIEDGEARLEPKTGVQGQMEEALDSDGETLAIQPAQVVEVTDGVVRIELGGE